jgi:hypothetical protein
VLNSKSVGSSSIRYKFLSAVTTDAVSYNAVKPGTTDTYNEDIQIWGVSMINLFNTFAGARLAKTHVINADGVTIAEVAIHKDDSASLPRPWVMIKGAPYLPPWCKRGNQDDSGHGDQTSCEAAGHDWRDGTEGFLGGAYNPLNWHFSSGIDYKASRNDGSDTYTTFFRFPIYCKGNTTAPNFRVGVDTADRTRATWFYRPVKAVGLDHGWV